MILQRVIPIFVSMILALLLEPESCYALQSHGATEGLYVHQMAHILFMGALAYLYWHTRITPDLVSKGWRYLRLFCLFFIGWNLVALLGHWVSLSLQPSDFIEHNNWHGQLLRPLSFLKILYYLAGMDHFLSVPALFFLYLSLRTFYVEARGGEES